MSHNHQHDTDFGRAFAIGVLRERPDQAGGPPGIDRGGSGEADAGADGSADRFAHACKFADTELA